MYSAFLLIGSNEGNRLRSLQEARKQIELKAGQLQQESGIYETEAWGKEDFPAHLNQALHLRTQLKPFELLEVIQRIEISLGRKRNERWGLRKIDIDIIYIENFIIQCPQLHVPHPLMHLRRFVLCPLTEIAPDFLHPVLLKTSRELLTEVADPLKVKLLTFVDSQLKDSEFL